MKLRALKEVNFSLTRSLSHVHQWIFPGNWPFFRSRADACIAQSLTHGNAFLRLYVNDYNCNKSCLRTCPSRLVPLMTQQYISTRDLARNPFSLATLVTQLSQDGCLWKGSGVIFTTLKCSFHLFSAIS